MQHFLLALDGFVVSVLDILPDSNVAIGSMACIRWDESNIRPKSEILVMAQSTGSVFRGEAVKDEENQAAVFDDIAASAPTRLGGLSLIVAYGLLDGNETSTSDCTKAYVQSLLSSSQPTCVLLPIELVPDHAKPIHQPCTPLIKSLYSHPLASASGQNHLFKVLAQKLKGGVQFEQLPSCFYFPSLRLALSVYVDDLTLSGPSVSHSKL